MPATPPLHSLQMFERLPISMQEAEMAFAMQRFVPINISGESWLCEIFSVRIDNEGIRADLQLISPWESDE